MTSVKAESPNEATFPAIPTHAPGARHLRPTHSNNKCERHEDALTPLLNWRGYKRSFSLYPAIAAGTAPGPLTYAPEQIGRNTPQIHGPPESLMYNGRDAYAGCSFATADRQSAVHCERWTTRRRGISFLVFRLAHVPSSTVNESSHAVCSGTVVTAARSDLVVRGFRVPFAGLLSTGQFAK